MIAKFPGTCAACSEPIKRGDTINFFGRGHAEHAAHSANRASTRQNAAMEEWIDDPEKYQDGEADEAAGLEPGTLANDRRLARRGLSVVRFNSGEVMTQNSRGRCEDAPCCGCCS